jgi:hypothetical protein
MASKRAQAHAKHGKFCSCGRIVHGNGAIYQHREMHRRASDGHKYVTTKRFHELFPGWATLPWPERGGRKVDGPYTA